jgi:hypothetical protein
MVWAISRNGLRGKCLTPLSSKPKKANWQLAKRKPSLWHKPMGKLAQAGKPFMPPWQRKAVNSHTTLPVTRAKAACCPLFHFNTPGPTCKHWPRKLW